MRILRLDLLRYGPFTDKVIKFRRDAKLHLVFGPNEAGKSSSLAAIGDLLFGFPKRKEFDFLHEASTLRVGAELLARDGTMLGFRRRRGNKKTLLGNDGDEAALHDDALAPYLGTLGREVFARAFGLNSGTLRDGGSAMLESEGEMGAALFAAASGLTGLARLRRGLESEADAIFAPRPSKERRFYQALDRYDTAITAEKRNELKSGDWKQLVEEIEEIERQLAVIKAQRTETNAALARLQRLKVVAPIVGAIDNIGGELQGLVDLPEAPEGFVAECSAALDAAEGAGGQERLADNEFTAAAAALDAIEVDETALAHADEVIERFSRRGDYMSKLGDIPRIELEWGEFTLTLTDLAGRLGYEDADAVVAALPSDAVIETGRGIVEAGLSIEQALNAGETRLGEELASVETRDTERSAAGVTDPKPYRDRLTALGPDLKQLEDRGYLETSVRNLEQKLKDGAMRLVPSVADIEQLAGAALPGRDTLVTHKAIFERIIGDRRAETIRLEANAQQHEDVTSQLIETEQSGPIAYEDTINLLRADRDASFAVLRHHLMRTGHLLTPAEVSERLMQYEEEIAEADSIADQAIADAHRISRVAAYRDKLEELAQERPAIEQRIAELQEEQAHATQAYSQLFAAAGIKPVGPDAMAGWLTAVEDLMATRRDIEAMTLQIANLDSLGGQIRGALLGIAEAVGLDGADTLPALAMSRLINARLDEMAERWNARLGFEGARQAARMRVGQIEDQLNKARHDHKAWRLKYEALLPQLGLASDTVLAGASAALSVWAAVPEISRQRANRAARVEGMRRDVDQFEADVFALARILAPVLLDLPPQGLIDVLRERAETARAGKARQDDARVRLEAAETRLLAARHAYDTAQAALDALAGMLPEGSDPRTELGRLERRAALRAELAERRKAFETAAEGVSEISVRSELLLYDRARAQFDAEDLERRSDGLHVENNKLYAQLGQKQAERQRLEAGTGSEFAAFERQGAEAEIVATARQWAVRKIAATMLGAAIERHRESQSDPLMLRAGALFSTLTSAAFSGLMQDYGEDDQPRLVGVRRNGERVAIAGMSEGTRDQLYLALRLAYIEDYADRTEPVPFIGDDIFQTFDDERTAAGIRAFASSSGLFQPILFTHHHSVVAIARRTLGEELDYVEL